LQALTESAQPEDHASPAQRPRGILEAQRTRIEKTAAKREADLKKLDFVYLWPVTG
jgi:hypothetical protein